MVEESTLPVAVTPLSAPASLPSSSSINFQDDALDAFFQDSLVPSSMDQTKYFLPRNKLTQALNFESVQSYLRTILLDTSEDLDELTKYICGSSSSNSGAKKLFATLILIQKPQIIVEFRLENLSDEDLPFKRSSMSGAHFHLIRRGTEDSPINLFRNWSRVDIQLFDDCQWYTLSPTFSFSDDGKALFYKFHNRTILPFTEYESEAQGGYSTIHKARIHPAHHDFQSITVRDRLPT